VSDAVKTLAGLAPDRSVQPVLSMKVGERVLLPAVWQAPREVLVVADGFSCRCQIEQGTDRHAVHLAKVLQLARRQENGRLEQPYREVGRVQSRPAALSKPTAAAVLAGTLLAAGGLGWLAGVAETRQARSRPRKSRPGTLSDPDGSQGRAPH
jgi:hypothetical protein